MFPCIQVDNEVALAQMMPWSWMGQQAIIWINVAKWYPTMQLHYNKLFVNLASE